MMLMCIWLDFIGYYLQNSVQFSLSIIIFKVQFIIFTTIQSHTDWMSDVGYRHRHSHSRGTELN